MSVELQAPSYEEVIQGGYNAQVRQNRGGGLRSDWNFTGWSALQSFVEHQLVEHRASSRLGGIQADLDEIIRALEAAVDRHGPADTDLRKELELTKTLAVELNNYSQCLAQLDVGVVVEFENIPPELLSCIGSVWTAFQNLINNEGDALKAEWDVLRPRLPSEELFVTLEMEPTLEE